MRAPRETIWYLRACVGVEGKEDWKMPPSFLAWEIQLSSDTGNVRKGAKPEVDQVACETRSLLLSLVW